MVGVKAKRIEARERFSGYLSSGRVREHREEG